MDRTNRPTVADIGSTIAAIDFDAIPAPVVETVQHSFLDTVGVCLLGTTSDPYQIAHETLGYDTDGDRSATILGRGETASPADATFLNGLAAHALDYDDVSDAITGHPSASLVPTIFAAAEGTGATGKDLITAYVAGFEAAAAIAEPITPEHYECGWHATATLGTFGCAAAVANLLELDADGVTEALNIAASMSAGLKRNFGSMVKPMHVGQTARSGLVAGLLASNEFTAADDAIASSNGFLDNYSGSTDVSERSLGSPQMGETIEANGIDFKKYPCCYFTHAAIDATNGLMQDAPFDAQDVTEVRVQASQGAADALSQHTPSTESEAKFSMEHAVAAALVGDVTYKSFSEDAVNDPLLGDTREKVVFETNEELPYSSYETEVRIRIQDGTTHSAIQQTPPGKAGNPLTEAERAEKFHRCASAVLPENDVTDLHRQLEDLTELDDVADLLELL